MKSLKNPSEKRGRPDVVHFALLDATSTPLFKENKIQIFIHTLQNHTIELKSGTRPPRTLQRFCGVVSKILSGSFGREESTLFGFNPDQEFADLVRSLGVKSAICFTRQGKRLDLDKIAELSNPGRIAWIVGGFAHGTFSPTVREVCARSISISDISLPAHVVTARICYELEKRLLS
jgi:rRNA small subunit pseudouridine methyltransferase Nep1